MDRADSRFADILWLGWMFLLVRGLAAIAFGLFTWARPQISLTALVLLFGAYAMIDGIMEVSNAIEGRHEDEHWWLQLIAGLVSIAVSILTFTTPRITALGLLFYIAAWAVAHGVLEIILAIRVRKEISGEWRLILAGIVSVLFGITLLAHPGAGMLAVLWLLGLYAIVFGLLYVMLAFKARSLNHHAARA